MAIDLDQKQHKYFHRIKAANFINWVKSHKSDPPEHPRGSQTTRRSSISIHHSHSTSTWPHPCDYYTWPYGVWSLHCWSVLPQPTKSTQTATASSFTRIESDRSRTHRSSTNIILYHSAHQRRRIWSTRINISGSWFRAFLFLVFVFSFFRTLSLFLVTQYPRNRDWGFYAHRDMRFSQRLWFWAWQSSRDIFFSHALCSLNVAVQREARGWSKSGITSSNRI